ncbi:MAG: hypothetical protein HZT40_13585 [Candidatus Thiothrix singaporensis]|uniref:Uncharacterized protein n=1 Tax=Candidatus Thiothrix singaporensis TaxID=2799669 RepID=A0A7L6ATJ3_9GAMM|nr:MAG: hypothetical protein HZT40_13585 [Candidatus Thiothrix singaporensis]
MPPVRAEVEPRQLESREHQRNREKRLTLSKSMTVLIHFHRSSYHCFKHYYLYNREWLHSAFPGLVSYSRFVYHPDSPVRLPDGAAGDSDRDQPCRRHLHCGAP